MGDEKKGFVLTTYEMLNAGYEEVAWSEDGKSIVVRNPERFGVKILPIHFGHSQFASWVRAANAHDFKKTGRGEWMHPDFQRECATSRPASARFASGACRGLLLRASTTH